MQKGTLPLHDLPFETFISLHFFRDIEGVIEVDVGSLTSRSTCTRFNFGQQDYKDLI